MTLVGSCPDASGVISNATAYTGLATGMKIAPCVVFPSGATITDIDALGLNFTVSPVSSEEAWKYTFTLYEPKAGGAAIVYVEVVAVSAAKATILISGAAVLLESSFLDKTQAIATAGGGNVPFSIHFKSTAFASATASGGNNSLSVIFENSSAASVVITWGSGVEISFLGFAAVSAKSLLTGGNESLSVAFSTLAEVAAEISGHLVFVQASGSNSATANAKATVTSVKYFSIHSTNPIAVQTALSGFNIFA